MARSSFASKFGFLAAAVGSAVGLGNIWKFPYEAGANGGGAFLLVYIISILIFGFPVLLTELSIGYIGKSNILGSFRNMSGNNHWAIIGVLGFLSAFLILGFYLVVAGWSLEFVFQSLINAFDGMSSVDISASFDSFRFHSVRPYVWLFVFVLLTTGVVFAGVQNGIERASKFLMPLLFAILVYLCIYALFLPGAADGLNFYLNTDFSKITPSVVVGALGQSFFSLSIGMGAMITYGSYIQGNTNISKTTMQIVFMDTMVAFLAGFFIFPAVFSYGIDPAAGPELVFITLPSVFSQMPGGYLVSILFFVLLSVAALTSTIAILEVVVSVVSEEFKVNRRVIILISAVVMIFVAVLCALSLYPESSLNLLGMSLFDLFDSVTSKFLMPVGGLLIVIFLGWFYRKEDLYDHLVIRSRCNPVVFRIYYFLLKFVVPILLLLILLQQIGIF